jgi:hypothetical protein
MSDDLDYDRYLSGRPTNRPQTGVQRRKSDKTKGLQAQKKLESLKQQFQLTQTRLRLLDDIIRKGPTVPSRFGGKKDRFWIPWFKPKFAPVNPSRANEIREELLVEFRKLLREIPVAEGAVKNYKKPEDSGETGGGGSPSTINSIWDKVVTYNVSAVKEAYFLPNKSFNNKIDPLWRVKGATDGFDKSLYAANTPSKVLRARQLWNKVTGSKGMIQTWKPPGQQAPRYLDKDGNFTEISDAKTLKRYGFQFLYNPGNISMTYGGVPDIDPSMMSSGLEEYNLANPSVYQSSINFEILLNRMFDMKYIADDGSLKGDVTLNELWPQNSPDQATRKLIKEKGTMYDIEFLLQTMFSYEPVRSQLRGKTSDIGFLGAFPVEMHLGKKLRYVVLIERISVNHVIFNDEMVPMFTTVGISAKRIPDFRGKKIKKA